MDLISWDEQLFLYLNNLGSPMFDGFWLFITNKLSWIPLYLILIYFLFSKLGTKGLLITLALAGIMIFFTDQISHYYKDILIQRFRPCYNEDVFEQMRLVKDSCGGKYGFFSGHATNHFAIAVLIGLIFKKMGYSFVLVALIIWASMIAYSRIYIGVHFPLDVFSGSMIGILFGNLFYNLWRMLLKN